MENYTTLVGGLEGSGREGDDTECRAIVRRLVEHFGLFFCCVKSLFVPSVCQYPQKTFSRKKQKMYSALGIVPRGISFNCLPEMDFLHNVKEKKRWRWVGGLEKVNCFARLDAEDKVGSSSSSGVFQSVCLSL